LIVKEAEGSSKISWVSTSRLDQHGRVLQKMREVLCDDGVYPYLSKDCAERLEQIRGVFRAAGLRSRSIVPMSGSRLAFFPWLGTRQINALLLILRRRQLQVFIRPGGFSQVYLDIECGSVGLLRKILSDVQRRVKDKRKPEMTGSVNIPGKFNRFIPKELLLKEFMEDYIDTDGLYDALEFK
jgi:ATP-dependent Lhr-like helicase